MARQYNIPGSIYINETGTKKYLIPSVVYVNESVATSVAATTEKSISSTGGGATLVGPAIYGLILFLLKNKW